ncbi:poly(A) RNA polymerase, mitochondrial [Nelusetta ayraudi]|uniref:poly(A) RNA polymerase, mitochondrial n=1 Tax=Nelusetta ayraudi TaxID=303726 RepID=UPI003F6F689B
MASPYVACRLRLGRRFSLAKNLRKVETPLKRLVGTNVAAVQGEPLGKDKAGVFLTLSLPDARSSRPLHTVQAERLAQAERSVLISCNPRANEKKFLKFLSRHGDISKYFFYESYGVYAVVEFTNRDAVASLLGEAAVPSSSHEAAVPFKSRLLSLKHRGAAESPLQPSEPQSSIPISQLIRRLSEKETIEQQMVSLTEAYQLTEENTRLRFLVSSLLKNIAAAYFPECNVLPFGSSVNGFGKLGCDLDMILDLDGISGRGENKPRSGLSLEYQLKTANSERAATQSILSVIGECVDEFGPGCVGVQKILNARCPLLRFSHQPSGFQCDLTANNRVAVKSTELLYLYGELDPRVRHLVFTVRCWARAHGVTSSIPGAWITNFSLTVMVLFFLQKRSNPVIPTVDHMKELAGPADKCTIEGNDCTFVSDLSRIHLKSNEETLEYLLREFFEFYAAFPFNKMSINIRKGREQNKPEVAPLHIQNPFETSLNVSKNVNATQLDRFVALCQECSWLLEKKGSDAQPAAAAAGPDVAPSPWGLAALLLPTGVAGVKSRKKRRREPASERIKSLLESLKKNSVPEKS